MKIYTKTGDDGTTALFDGKRVLKSNSQVETYGSIDELSSVLGMVISALGNKKNVSVVSAVQKDLYRIMAFLAGKKVFLSAIERTIKLFEQEIDVVSSKLPKLNRFILPQGNQKTTLLHFARTVCRRSERTVVLYAKNSLLLKNPNILLIIKYLNRLSDLLFTLARQASYGKDIVV